MTRKRNAIPGVKLERHPHRDAKERLRQAYHLLIDAQQTEKCTEVENEEKAYQEVLS